MCHHALCNGSDAFGQRLAYCLRVEGIVILHHHAARLYLDVNLKLRNVQLEHFLTDKLPADSIFRQHTHLVGVGNSGTEAIVGSDAGEGIVLVAQRLVEGLAGLPQERADGGVVDVESEGEGVDKHTHRVGNLQVRATAAHRAEIYFAIVRIARDDVAHSSQIQVCRCDVMLSAEGSGFVEVSRADGFANKALTISLGQVGRYLAGTLAGLQFLGKELLGRPERIAVFSILLVANEIEVGIALFLDRRTVEYAVELADEQIDRTTVEHQVVDIHQQVCAVLGLHHLEAVEWRLLQVERTDEVLLIRGQLIVGHFRYGNLYGYAVFHRLHNFVSHCRKVNAQLRMSLHHLLDGLCQLVGISAIGIAQETGNVIDGRGGILHALEVDTRLGVAQWNRRC